MHLYWNSICSIIFLLGLIKSFLILNPYSFLIPSGCGYTHPFLCSANPIYGWVFFCLFYVFFYKKNVYFVQIWFVKYRILTIFFDMYIVGYDVIAIDNVVDDKLSANHVSKIYYILNFFYAAWQFIFPYSFCIFYECSI